MMVAFKQGVGVLEVLFGVGFGGGDALKRFVEDVDDPLLFGKGGGSHRKTLDVTLRDEWLARTTLREFYEREEIVEKPSAALSISRRQRDSVLDGCEILIGEKHFSTLSADRR
jgi:hypothetical protein